MIRHSVGTAILLGSTAVAVGVMARQMRARRPAIAAQPRRHTLGRLSPRTAWMKLRIFSGTLGWAAESLAARLDGFLYAAGRADASNSDVA